MRAEPVGLHREVEVVPHQLLARLGEGGLAGQVDGSLEDGVALHGCGRHGTSHAVILPHGTGLSDAGDARPPSTGHGRSHRDCPDRLGGMPRRRAALALLALVLPLGLAACEKPNPGASVFSGTTTEYQQAACWQADGAIDIAGCARDVLEGATSGDRLATIPVVPGDTIGISVDPVVADAGWVPSINGQGLAPAPITSTYYRFTFPEFQEVPADGLIMELVAGSGEQARGLWLFRLVPAS